MKDSDLPPTGKGRVYEIYAHGLREFAGLRSPVEPLDPFALARYANLRVAKFEDVAPLLSEQTRLHLLGDGKDAWSGGACSQTLPDGSKLIILNPTHSRNRQNATLMEEICHVFLGHRPSRLAISEVGEDGKLRARDYNKVIEEQAYSIGAAALVPYAALREFVDKGWSSRQIARRFRVSRMLVEYRVKVSRLWQSYLDAQARGLRAQKER